MTSDQQPSLRGFTDGFRWEGVACQPYKEGGAAPFRSIARQVLFAEPALGCELRYFEMAPGGYSTLERHEHVHAVMILRGHGQCLLGNQVQSVKPFDLITIPSWCWHQFQASGNEPLGFLCMVNAQRDRPQLPSKQDLIGLRANPAVAAFLGGQSVRYD
ncbi:MAG TPA: cupin domain-containing protein [Acetobacteraceae bacterium]|nr:cupin domain-containing protein [Acetobacteraceae bacterium]